MSSELRLVADLMCIAARTAPKSAGQDYVVTAVVEGQACRELGEAMIRFGEETGKPNFDRDGKNVLASPVVVLIGIKDARPLGIGCGACGSAECIKPNQFEAEFKGPQCAFRLLDMGIALGSAVKTAGLLNVDNRIMYRVGSIARRMGLIDADYVMGIPLSVTGKSIYFDRKS
ncbi:MAG: hypothetical protein BWY10_00291 [Chloroflexi bacterium ADurb.Bin180]|jgi:uncharacterized ferredoxin-like protein|nr:MAG: hypothetical protein BWY10_00291 [Chloroflexi bacterium ADurb.Bin180]HOU24863.1 DUF2148 domain-containing protein [Anaerolineae bacterium]HQJ50423.1 DUF2148 domain-containing protein [Anaerolineae bacterium]